MSGAQRIALAAIALYRRLLSPLFPPACRYMPTCSEYASEAIARFGVMRGARLAALRLCVAIRGTPRGTIPFLRAFR